MRTASSCDTREDKHGDCYCGSYKLFALNGKSISLKELVDNNIKELEVLAYDEENNNFKLVKAHSFRIGQYSKKNIIIHLSEGYKIECTPNHPHYVKNIGWVKAEDLKINDHLLGAKLDVYSSFFSTTYKIENIEYEEVDDEPMYDFTVDGYQNALIEVTSSKSDYVRLIVAHNSSIYGALANMAVNFKNNIPYIYGQGGFGGLDGSGAASSRYCLEGDTIIDTSIGKIRIDSLPGIKDALNEIIDISEFNIYAKGAYGSINKITHAINSGYHTVWELKLMNGLKLRGTSNHLVLTSYFKDNQIHTKWKMLCQLTAMDYVVIDNGVNVKYKGKSVPMNDNFVKYMNSVQIESVTNTGIEEAVYSVRIESECHSFVSNNIISHNTECKLTKFTEDYIVNNLTSNTVPHKENYDNTLLEPEVLPVAIPNILLNSNMNVAIAGYNPSWLPHNILEILNLCIAYVGNRKMDWREMMNYLKGPDFPTGGSINGTELIKKAYSCGDGNCTVRGKWHIEKVDGSEALVIDQIAYSTNRSSLVEGIVALVENGKLDVKDIRDESDFKNECRIVIIPKKNEDIDRVINLLLKFSEFEKNIRIYMVALVNGKPKQVNLEEIMKRFIEFREVTVYNIHYERLQAKLARFHIVEGLIKVLNDLEHALTVIRKSSGRAEVKENLIKKFKLSEKQAEYIMEMALYRLNKLDHKKFETELKELKAEIKDLEEITSSKSNKRIDKIMVDEWKDMLVKFKDHKRRTNIIEKHEKITIDNTIKEENCTIIISKNGYIKRINAVTGNVQGRGGIGLNIEIGDENDEIKQIINTTTTRDILAITSKGRGFTFKPYILEEMNKNARGKLTKNILNLHEKEEVILYIELASVEFDSLMMVTNNGIVKSTNIKELININSNGKKVINLENRARVTSATLVKRKDDVLITTKYGNSLRISVSDVRDSGVGAQGVRGMRPQSATNDEVISIVRIIPKRPIVFISTRGFIKKVKESDFNVRGRGGHGVVTSPRTPEYGEMVGVLTDEFDTITIATRSGKTLTCELKNITVVSRGARGVKGIKLTSNDEVVSVN